MHNHLRLKGFLILLIYFAITIVIAWFARKRRADANDLLNASRALPLWIVASAFLAANCGALEVVGLSAMTAQYGVQAFHFYWIGAIPGMIFLSLWMIPVYIKSGVRSVPEYLEARYGCGVRRVNACLSAVTMVVLAGINLYAMAQVLHVVLGLSFATGVLLSAVVVLTSVLLGGVRATIYNEVFQLAVMLAGLLPLMVRTLPYAEAQIKTNSLKIHLWTSLPLASPGMPLDKLGVVAGLGFILSFSYWATDFVLLQRALATRSDMDMRQVPIWAGFGKLGISFLVVLPGLAAARLLPELSTTGRFDQALPTLMTMFYGPAMLGVGLTALTASLMSGLAANISAFAAIWTEDIYRPWLHPGAKETHYLQMGVVASVAAMAVSALASGASFYFGDLMEQVQLIFSLFSAPFWAVFLLGITTRRVNARGAFAGLLSGAAIAIIHHVFVFLHWLHYGSMMNANFHVAIYGFLTALVVAWTMSGRSTTPERVPRSDLGQPSLSRKGEPMLIFMAALLLLACVWLNIYWR